MVDAEDVDPDKAADEPLANTKLNASTEISDVEMAIGDEKYVNCLNTSNSNADRLLDLRRLRSPRDLMPKNKYTMNRLRTPLDGLHPAAVTRDQRLSSTRRRRSRNCPLFRHLISWLPKSRSRRCHKRYRFPHLPLTLRTHHQPLQCPQRSRRLHCRRLLKNKRPRTSLRKQSM